MHPTNRSVRSICRGGGAALATLLLGGALAVPAVLAQNAPQPPSPAGAATAQPAGPAAATPAQPSSTAPVKSTGVRNLPNRFAGRAGLYYKVVWGIDSLTVKWTESGEVIRFSWRVLDPQLAKVLNDKKAEPSLIDPAAGVGLVVPVMEKIGQLRQTQPPEAGRSYWMAFSNKGRLVKRGDRVNVVVGPFRAEGLVVD
jgi:hypothetical protein